MGNLFKPSVPSSTPTYVPPVAAPKIVKAANNDTQQNTNTQTDKADDNQAQQDAAKDVIRKASRGRNSTILTSLRGVLSSENDLKPQRKSLLGE